MIFIIAASSLVSFLVLVTFPQLGNYELYRTLDYALVVGDFLIAVNG
jgi:hypothetical protein